MALEVVGVRLTAENAETFIKKMGMSSDAVSEFDSTAQDATGGVSALSSKTIALTSSVESLKIETTDLNLSLQKTSAGAEELATDLGKADTKADGLGQGLDQAKQKTKGLGDAFDKTSTEADGLGTSTEKTKQKTKGLGDTFGDTAGKGEGLGEKLKKTKTDSDGLGDSAKKTSEKVDDLGDSANRAADGGLNSLNVRGMALAVTIGNLAAGAISYGINALKNFGSEAFGAVAANEMLTMSLNTLVSKELRSTDATLSMTDALEAATPITQDLTKWIQELAIKSPFDQAGVAEAFRMSMALGATTGEAKRLTTALIDFSTASGGDSFQMQRIALALGQMRAKGKLTGEEMLQLTEAGLSVRDILIEAGAEIGLTTENFDKMQSKGLIPATFAIEAITSALEEDFGGAAERASGTLSGLSNSIADLKTVGLREFFTGTFSAIQPYLNSFVGWLMGAIPTIRSFGDSIGEFIGGGLEFVARTITNFMNFGFVGGGVSLIGRLFPTSLVDEGKAIFRLLVDEIGGILGGADFGEFSISGMFDRLVDYALPKIEQGLQFIIANWDTVSAVIQGSVKTVNMFIDTAKSLYEVGRLLLTGDFRGGIFGLEEDSGEIAKLFEFRDAIIEVGTAVKNFAVFVVENWSTIGPVIAGIVAAFVAFKVIMAGLAIFTFISGLITTFTTGLAAMSLAISWAGGLIPFFVALIGGPLTLAIGAVVAAVGLLTAAWVGNWGGIQEKTAAAWAVIQPYLQSAYDWVAVNLPKGIEFLRVMWVDVVWPAITSALSSAWVFISGVFNQLVTWVNTSVIPTVLNLYAQWSVIWATIATVTQNVWTIISTIFAEVVRWVTANILPMLESLYGLWVLVVWPEIQKSVETAWGAIKIIFTALYDWVKQKIEPVFTAFYLAWSLVWWPAIQKAVNDAWAIVKPIFDLITYWAKTEVNEGMTSASNIFTTAWSAIQIAVQNAWATIEPIFTAIKMFAAWLSSTSFDFEFNIPDIPSWATPGSPIPLHTAWKNFGNFLDKQEFAPALDFGTMAPAGGPVSQPATAQQISNRTTYNTNEQIINFVGNYASQPQVTDRDSLAALLARS